MEGLLTRESEMSGSDQRRRHSTSGSSVAPTGSAQLPSRWRRWRSPFLGVIFVAGALLVGYFMTRPTVTTVNGVRTYSQLSADHITAPMHYAQKPPAGGDHAAMPLTCGIFDRRVSNENAVHSLEHGALWITYRPGLNVKQLAALRRLTAARDHRLLSPYPGLPAPIVATAWGKQLYSSSADSSRLDTFVKKYTEGPTTPEPGAPCRGVGHPSG